MSVRSRVLTVSSRLALPLVAQWRRQHEDPIALLRSLGLDEAHLRPLDARMALDRWAALHAACSDQSGNPAFALDALAHLERDAFPIGMHLVSSQRTILDGVRFVGPYLQSVADGLQIDLVLRGERSQAHFRLAGEPLGPPEFAEYLLALLWAFVRYVAPDSRSPSAVRLAHRWARHGAALADFFSARVRFGEAQVGFDFQLPSLDVHIPSADPDLGRVLASSAATILAAQADELRLADRVRPWLRHHLAGEQPIATRLAAAMHMSARSLRRKLADEDTSLRDLVDEVRHERAIALLEAGRWNLERVALEVGFASASAFGRAFRKWTGRPPTDFVRASAAGATRKGADRRAASLS